MTALLLVGAARCSSRSTASSWPRSSRSCARAARASRSWREEGAARRAHSRSIELERHHRVPVGLPARHHARLDRHRLPRRAGDRARCSSRRFGGALARRRGRDLRSSIAYLLVTVVHITVGEQVPKVLRDPARRRHRAADRAAAARSSRASSTRSSCCSTAPRTGSCGCCGVDPDAERRGGGTPEELKRLIAESYTGGKLDAGEAGMLARRLPPARAGGAPGDDADPRGRHGRRLRDGRGGAAALRRRPATRGWS